MSFAFIAGIRLSSETKTAWKMQGGISMRWRDEPDEMARAINALGSRPEFFLNLGHSGLEASWFDIPVINAGDKVGALIYPESVRTELPDLAVPRPTDFSTPQKVWIKPPGYRGRGKTTVTIQRPLVLPEDWDWQSHVDGTEYRVLTVGRRAVQGFIRSGTNDDREYNWTGLSHTPEAVLSAARQAAKHFERKGYAAPHNTMYAWDLIQTPAGQVYLFEGNTCPGISEPSAYRVVNEITRQIEEGRITPCE